ncbi:MAG: hypothetical protein Q7T55_05130 [Solirubrobacteraceae bacterium]|nr:hypothetical protein [Solirubrobacteraceae bacterium]
MDFYDRIPDERTERDSEPTLAREPGVTEHGWVYRHRRRVGLAVVATWMVLVALSASTTVGDEPVGVGMALFMGAVLLFLFAMPTVSVISLIGSPPLGQEDAAEAVERIEEALSARIPFRVVRRCFGRAVGTFGFPFGIGGTLLLISGLGLVSGPEDSSLVFRIGEGLLVGSVALTVLVGVTSYPSVLLPQSYRALYGRTTWIDRLRGQRGDR